MNTDDLKYFLAIYQEKSFAQAAKNLFLTQQGVGKIVRRLENELGVPLVGSYTTGDRTNGLW